MKRLKYNLIQRSNTGTPEVPIWEESKGAEVTLEYCDVNLEIARREAWNDEVKVLDDGQPEVQEAPSVQKRIAALEAAVLAMMEVQNG